MYTSDREWSDTYDGQVVSIIKHLPVAYFMNIDNAPVERDKKCATDFVFKLIGGDMAARLRRSDCSYRDLTIRSLRDSGAKTELAKIKEGYAFRYFYGWMNIANIIKEWILVDLDKVRSSGLLDINRRNISNGDGTYFISISINELRDAGCLLIRDTNNLYTSRNVNVQASLDEGIERARNAKYYNPELWGNGT